MHRRVLLAGSAALFATGALCGPAMANAKPKLIVPSEEAPHERTFTQWPVIPSVANCTIPGAAMNMRKAFLQNSGFGQ